MENNNEAKELANKIWDETIGKEELMYNKETSPKIHPKNVLCDAMGCVKFDEVLPVSEPVKEKIEVDVADGFNNAPYFRWVAHLYATTNIPKDKFPAIKQAIENCLNPTTAALNDTVVEDRSHNLGIRFEYNGKPYGWDMPKKEWADWIDAQIHYEKRYTQSEVDAIRKEAFEAARLTHSLIGMRFDNYDEYLSSLNLNTNDKGKKSSELKQGNDWEITHYRNKTNNEIFELASVWNNTIYKEGFKDYTGEFSKHPCFEIYSVKRLSDNLVFSVGNIVGYNDAKYLPYIITNFFIKDGGMLARSEGNTYCELVDENLISYSVK